MVNFEEQLFEQITWICSQLNVSHTVEMPEVEAYHVILEEFEAIGP